jgi:hypothetical protein
MYRRLRSCHDDNNAGIHSSKVNAMPFDWVLTMFTAKSEAPRIDFLNKGNQNCRFAPLGSRSGNVMTADVGLWDLSGGQMYSFDENTVSLLDFKDEERLVIALVDSCAFDKLWSVLYKDDERQIMVPLDGDASGRLAGAGIFSWSILHDRLGCMGFIDLGFDVIDPLTGTSALADIGYSDKDLVKMKEFDFQANEHGLLSTLAEGASFAKFASSVEDAPFMPVKVIANRA